MPQDMLDEAELEKQMRGMTDRQLSEFTARQIFSVGQVCATHTRQIADLQAQDRKAFGMVGGLAGFFGTFIGAALLYIYQKLRGG